MEGGVSVPVLGVHKRLPMIPVEERGHKVRVAPVAGIMQGSLKILQKKNPVKCLYMMTDHNLYVIDYLTRMRKG